MGMILSFILLLPAWVTNAFEVKPGFKEELWVFDFVDKNIRFSHGSHKARERWFKQYFDSGYKCSVCHNTSIPVEGPNGVKLSEGEPLNSVEEIKEQKYFPFPYGVKMIGCLGTCHDGKTAPNNCDWCHVPGSKPLQGMTK